MVLPEVVWHFEQEDNLGFDLRGQGQGRWQKNVNFDRKQRIAGMWIKMPHQGVTFRCECNADLAFDPRGQGQGQRADMGNI